MTTHEHGGIGVSRKRTALSLGLLGLLLVGAACLKVHYQVRYAEREPLANAPYGDSVVFIDEARRHFGASAASDAGGAPIAFYKSPLYTALVAASGAASEDPKEAATGRLVLRALQSALGLLVLFLVFRMAERRGGVVAGAIAFLLALGYAPLTQYESKLLDTVLGLATLVLACALLDCGAARPESEIAGRTRVSTGAAFGLAAIARGGNLLALALTTLGLVTSRRWKSALAIGGVAALVVLPVAVHNFRASGDLVPVSYSEGSAFLQGNGPEGRGLLTTPPGWSDGVLNERLDEQRVARAALGHEPSAGEQRDFSYREGWRYLTADPSRIPGLVLDKLYFTASPYEVGDNDSLLRERERFGLLTWARVPFTLLLILGLFGLGAGARAKLALVVPILAGVAALLLYYVSSRYRLPLAPFLSIAAGDGVAAVVGRRVDRTRFVSGLALAAVVVLVLVFVEAPYSSEQLRISEQMFDRFLDEHARRAGAGH